MKPTSLPTAPAVSRSPHFFFRAISRWPARVSGAILALLLAASAGRAVAGPEISIEEPVGRVLGSRVVAWGRNYNGQTTVPVAAQNGVQAIAAGVFHTVALKSDGSVVAWGGNNDGQTTVPVAAQNGVQAIAAGAYHTVALKSDGSVVAWGRNYYGQTTVPVAAQNGVQAIAAGGNHTVALKSDGSVVAWGWNGYGQAVVPVSAQSGVQAIAAGGYHTVALKSDGSVVAWGDTAFGQTAVPVAAQSGVQAIVASWYHTVALKSDGSVVAWGPNFSGETTVPPAAQSGVQAIAAGAFHTVALKSDGSVVAWGDNADGQATVLPAAQSGVQAIAAGAYHTVVLVNPVVSFAAQSAGTPSAAKTFTIKNTGDAALSLTGVTVLGANAGDFSVTTTGMASSVAATTGETTFTVTFSPTAAGVRQATLRVASDDADEASYDIPLTGTGLVSEIRVFTGATTSPLSERPHDAGAFSFFDTAIGADSISQTFTIRNTGEAHLTGLAVNSSSDQFSITQPLASSLAPTESTTFTVTFRPTSSGAKVTVLNIVSNAANHGSFIINMDGIAYALASPFFFFTNGLRTIELDPRTTATSGRAVTGVDSQPASGTVTLVSGKLRYVPNRATPAANDSFTYRYELGTGGEASAEVRIRNVSSAAGDYDGLVQQPGVTPGAEDFDRSGLLRVTVAKTGAITGRLQLAGGTVRAFSGSFAGGTGTVVVKVARAPMAPIDLTLIYDPSAGRITGSAASFDNVRHPIHSVFSLEPRAPAGARAGDYTMFIVPDTTLDSPQGTSFACVKIRSDGSVTLVGRLADGSPFSSGTGLHAQQTFAFYAGLYPGDRTMQGSVRGTMNFPSTTAPGSPAATALAIWYKPYRPLDRHFPHGFALSRAGELFTYTRPAVRTRILALANAANNGRIIVDHAGPNGFTANFTLPQTNVPFVSVPNPARVALTFDLASGLFRGGFNHPVSNRRLTFFGAVCQPRVAGAGFFLGTGPTDGCHIEIGSNAP